MHTVHEEEREFQEEETLKLFNYYFYTSNGYARKATFLWWTYFPEEPEVLKNFWQLQGRLAVQFLQARQGVEVEAGLAMHKFQFDAGKWIASSAVPSDTQSKLKKSYL